MTAIKTTKQNREENINVQSSAVRGFTFCLTFFLLFVENNSRGSTVPLATCCCFSFLFFIILSSLFRYCCRAKPKEWILLRNSTWLLLPVLMASDCCWLVLSLSQCLHNIPDQSRCPNICPLLLSSWQTFLSMCISGKPIISKWQLGCFCFRWCWWVFFFRAFFDQYYCIYLHIFTIGSSSRVRTVHGWI